MKLSKVMKNAILPSIILVMWSITVLVDGQPDLLFIPAIIGAGFELLIIGLAFKMVKAFKHVEMGWRKYILLVDTIVFFMFVLIPYVNSPVYNWLMSGMFVFILLDLITIPKTLKMIGK